MISLQLGIIYKNSFHRLSYQTKIGFNKLKPEDNWLLWIRPPFLAILSSPLLISSTESGHLLNPQS